MVEPSASLGWNPGLYMKFERERTRAARDLLAAVPLIACERAFDLGCGPGNSVELLIDHFPAARVVGIDTSDAMIAHARRRAPGAEFRLQDIQNWEPEEPVDLIFANAALHFLPRPRSMTPAALPAEKRVSGLIIYHYVSVKCMYDDFLDFVCKTLEGPTPSWSSPLGRPPME